MLDRLRDKISKLSSEARRIMQERDVLNDRISDIDIRLHQIAGAMSELDTIIVEINNEISTTSRSTIPTVPGQTDEASTTSETGI